MFNNPPQLIHAGFDNTSYKSNPLLRPANVKYRYNKHEAEELYKCKRDPIYFIENYIKIVHVDRGLINFKLFDFQKKMIRNYVNERYCISLTARQMGKTTVMAAFFVWYTIFYPKKTCAILANKASVAREILHRYQESYQYLPKFLQQGIKVFNKGSVELENGSRIFASSTAGNAIRGYTINLLYLDEYAFVPSNIADEFYTSVVPTISSGKKTKIVVTSTPNGYNHFYNMWNEAIEGTSGYVPLEVKWDQHPDRDEEWKADQIKKIGAERFEQEYDIEFLGGQNTLISARALKNLSPKRPIIEKDSLKIYEEPKKGHNYMIFVDPSEGTGNDFSSFSVIDVTEFPLKQVAAYYDSSISPLLLPTVIEQTGYKYNKAGVLIETNGPGMEVANVLYRDLEYEDMIILESPKKKEYGVRTTKRTKRIGCSTLKDLVESTKLLLHDHETIKQLANFVSRRNSYAAKDGEHDDLVMTLVNLAWFTTTDLFVNLTDNNFKEIYRNQRQQQIEDEILPFGFIHNGIAEKSHEDSDDIKPTDSTIDDDGFDLKSLIYS